MPVPARLICRLGLGALTLAAVSLGVWYASRPEPRPESVAALRPDPSPPDPRLTFDTPYRNVKPGIKSVGDAACATCHPAICDSYHAHPMGRSAAYLAGETPLEKYHPSAPTTFKSGVFDLTVKQVGDGVEQRIHLRESSPAPVADVVLPVQVAIGSGTRGRSYLNVEQGRVWQTPVSWFGREQHWDLSPGFRLGRTVRRPIAPACFYCHVDQVEPIAGSENRYCEPLFARQASVGCERCHGPGELHVAERTDGSTAPAPDTSIVNPRHLVPALQLAICEQCHLQGEERIERRGRSESEFRPGLPFDLFVSTYVRDPALAEANRSVGQFEQLEQSRCFTQSNGRMTCTTCHDPHASPPPETRPDFYRARCLTCHETPGTTGCALAPAARQPKQNNCIECHMPKASSANIAHASVTDHRIPRNDTPRPKPQAAPDALPLVRFRAGAALLPAERERDLGIALANFAALKMPRILAAFGDPRALAAERLTASLAKWPGDAEAWQALAGLHAGRGQVAERLKAATAAVELAPDSETALMLLAGAATEANEFGVAEEAVNKLIRLNPTASEPLVTRAFMNLRRGAWVEAEADCRAALQIQPLHPEARLYLALCLRKKGDSAAGLREARTAALLESDPGERASLLEWYQRAAR